MKDKPTITKIQTISCGIVILVLLSFSTLQFVKSAYSLKENTSDATSVHNSEMLWESLTRHLVTSLSY